MHGHLKDVLIDFGPVQEFWCFSFERFNGILGNQPTNNRAVEPQLFQRFLQDRFANAFEFPDEFKEDFSSINISSERLIGSVADTVKLNTEFKLPSKSTRGVFDSVELIYLKQLYSKIFPDTNENDVAVNSIYTRYSCLTIKGKMYRSSGKRTQKPYVVLASWDKEALFGAPPTQLPDSDRPMANERPVNIHYYLKTTVSGSNSDLILASVSWFYPHPDRWTLGKPAQLWCSNMFESFGMYSFLPLSHLICRCAHGTKLMKDEQLLVVVPLVE